MEQFLHGVEVVNIDDGLRPIRVASSSVIGIVGTAPRADASVFPLNTPVLLPNSRAKAAKLLALASAAGGDGTLPAAIDSIFDQAAAVVVVVRVEQGDTAAETLANMLGGANAITGKREGVHALLDAQSIHGVKPRILIAPGFTHQRLTDALLTLSGDPGSGYTDGTWPLTISGGGGGAGATATATIVGGAVTARTITNRGTGYTAAPEFSLPAGAGAGSGATFVAAVGDTKNAVVAELEGIAERLRAVIIADGPSTTDEAAIAYAGDYGNKRVYMVDPRALRVNGLGEIEAASASACVAGVISRTDNERGWWWSPSNQEIFGIVGTERAVDFLMGDATSRANLLNAQNVSTIIRENGFRLWGNRTLAADQKWAFLCVVRTADIIADSLQEAHLWAVDRGITKNYVNDVRDGVNAFLRDLKAKGAILGGQCYLNPELNTETNIAQGRVYWDFDFTPVYPAEHLTFRAHLVNSYITELF